MCLISVNFTSAETVGIVESVDCFRNHLEFEMKALED